MASTMLAHARDGYALAETRAARALARLKSVARAFTETETRELMTYEDAVTAPRVKVVVKGPDCAFSRDDLSRYSSDELKAMLIGDVEPPVHTVEAACKHKR